MPLVRPDASFFVLVHIPKTAGTTVGSVLDRTLFRRVLFDYPEPEDYGRPDKELAGASIFVSSWFAGIHGHFQVTRHLDSFRSAKFLLTVRHPVERIISQYLHELNDFSIVAPWHQLIKSGETDVVTFASQDGIRNAMSKHLSGLDLTDYDLLLISERLPLSFHLLNHVIGNLDIPVHFGDPPVLPMLNGSSARSLQLQFNEVTRQKIFACAEEDVEVYMRANESLDRMARKHLG